MPVSEEQLERWARGPSATETDQCDTTVRRITQALRPHFGDRVAIFPQGSYRNRTNIRQDSDVDVVVRDNQTFYPDTDQMTPQALARFNATRSQADHTFEQFKTKVHQLLRGAFGARVERRNKCILVPETASGVNGDVVPCFVHRRFDADGNVTAEGIEFDADDGRRYNSFPDQHYANGTAKNEATKRMYKRMVRILKNVRGELVERGELAPDAMHSFFTECVVFNGVPNSAFLASTYYLASKQVMEALWNALKEESTSKFVEVNELKYLFFGGRTAEQARVFLQAAYTFIGH